MLLNELVEVAFPESGKLVWFSGTIVGRTLGAQRHYDFRFPDGRIIANLAATQVRSLASYEK